MFERKDMVKYGYQKETWEKLLKKQEDLDDQLTLFAYEVFLENLVSGTFKVNDCEDYRDDVLECIRILIASLILRVDFNDLFSEAEENRIDKMVKLLKREN